MSTTIMARDPRWVEFQQAAADTYLGLDAPVGARERYRQAQLPYVQLLAEHTPDPVRPYMIEALYDGGMSLGIIAMGFTASQVEIERIQNRPPIEPEPLDAIEQLQQMSYRLYLKTAHWQKVRQAALQRAERRCALCNATQRLEVHHRTYDRRGCERPADVVVLCDSCHSRHHGALRAA